MLKKKKGFTLIELMVVVLIIAILSAIALPQYRIAVEKTRITTNIPMLKALHDAIIQYYGTKGEFPTSFSKLSVTVPKGIYTVSGKTITKSDSSCIIILQDANNPPALDLTCKMNGGGLNDWIMSFQFVTINAAQGGGLTPGDRLFKVQTTDEHNSKLLRQAALSSGWQDLGGGTFRMP